MTLKKFVSTLSAFTLVLTIGCGGGKEASHADEGEDDGEREKADDAFEDGEFGQVQFHA